MDIHLILLTTSFFFIALVYASVGFGGGSSYLALLGQSIVAFSQMEIKATALLCNIIVVTGGSLIFYREGKISLKEIAPYFIASIPLAYLGGLWKLEDQTFFLLLGNTLVVAAVLLWIQPEKYNSMPVKVAETTTNKLMLGGSVGLLSGLVSIGGGIFLSPILHIIRWMDAKKISALASVFILVNSISGLAGQFQSGIPALQWNVIIPLLLAVFMGGQIGSRLGAKTFNPLYIKRITAIVIFVAAVNIIRKYL